MSDETRRPLRDVYGRLSAWRRPEPKAAPVAVPPAALPPGPAVRRTVRQAYAGRFGGKSQAPAAPATAVMVRHVL